VIVGAIVLAAGRGDRFGGGKPFAVVAGQRLVDRAVELVTPQCGPPVLALPAGMAWDGPPVAAVVEGGASRTDSTRRALAALPPEVEGVVLHDVVRPLAAAAQIRALIDALAEGADAAVPIWTPPDTVKRIRDDGTVEHLGREGLGIAQSPMAFRVAMLRRVFAETSGDAVEETVGVERLGGRVVAVPGDPWSHHVVEPRDVELLGRLLAGG
jgi:2-C-methyl-D-erythritol 4-phosphate cytidylyltransferase